MAKDWRTAHQMETVGISGHFGVQINISAPEHIIGKEEALSFALFKAGQSVMEEMTAITLDRDPSAQERAGRQRREMVGLFSHPIFVEEIPNGYCPQACCRHLPWFVITTVIGRFKVGWRKSVIHLEWTETVGTKDAESLFSAENTTKDDKMIHAWSTEDARRYVMAIFDSTHEEINLG